MGRGAGNLCTELIIYEISHINKDKYNSDCILNCLEYISKNLNFNNITWGYNINYFMSINLLVNFPPLILRFENYFLK